MSSRRWKAVALLSAGMLLGLVVVGTPAGAHVSNWAHNWTKHIRPKADKRYLPGQNTNLIGGKTVRGVFALECDGSPCEAGDISFIYGFASAPTPHYIMQGSAPPAECPGTVANPRARPGHLCVYENNFGGPISARGVFDPTADFPNVATRFGAGVYIVGTAGNKWIGGTWAATAPKKSSASSLRAAPASRVNH